MTKERRLAIKMWKDLLKLLQKKPLKNREINVFKESFCQIHDVDWKNECWLCQYVRQDYRWTLESRRPISRQRNNCKKCPLYKWYAKHHTPEYDMCGCDTAYDTLYGMLIHGLYAEQIYAAELILKALKGEEI